MTFLHTFDEPGSSESEFDTDTDKMLQCNFHYVQASEEEMAKVGAATKQMEEELASPPSWPQASLPIIEMMKMPGLGKAFKIMDKYGFRAGEGLGKQS